MLDNKINQNFINETRSNGLIKAQEHARKRGGVCLSTEYVNARTKMKWHCSNPNHPEWESNFDHVVSRDRWCQKCAYDKAIIKNGYEQAVAYAKNRGGKCLSSPDTIIKSHIYLTWQCDKGHEPWEALYRNVVELGGWCPKCAGRFAPEEYIQKAKELAIKKGGQCLSNKYENQNTILEWQCEDKNHPRFLASYSNVVNKNSWCNLCKLNLKEPHRIKMLKNAKNHAETKGGKCNSTVFINTLEKLNWQCSKGHIWEANYNNVLNSNRWCPKCAGQLSPEENLDKAKNYALSRGGQCLSTKYTPKERLLWKCKEKNHKPWYAMISITTTKFWCPECGNSNYYKENNSRVILEYLLKCKLPTSYESWNINPKTDKELELDGYNEERKIAFEFQGRHHFQPNIFKNQDLDDIQFKDKIKKENCVKKGVTLIEVIDNRNIKTLDDLIKYIEDILQEKNIKFDMNYDKEDLLKKISIVNNISVKDEKLKMAKEYAQSRGGECLSDSYINYGTHLKWKCSNDKHPVWESGIWIVTNKNWCKLCSNKRK